MKLLDSRQMKKACQYCGSTTRYESYFGEAMSHVELSGFSAYLKKNLNRCKGILLQDSHMTFCCTSCLLLFIGNSSWNWRTELNKIQDLT